MFPRTFVRVLASFLVFASAALAVRAQEPPRPQVSPGVERAVLLGRNSIQLDRDVAVIRGDVIVNNASTTPVLGEADLSLDRDVHTPPMSRIMANSIDIDGGAVVGSAVFYNTLNNQGQILGPLNTPLALPVFTQLPPPLVRSAGTDNVTVSSGALDLDSGEYAALVVGRNATVRLTGGGYVFTSISVDRGGKVLFRGPSLVSVVGNVTMGSETELGPEFGFPVDAGRIGLFVNGTGMTVGSTSICRANVNVGNGSLDLGSDTDAAGQFIANDIHAGRGSHFVLESALNRPPAADPQNVFTSGAAPLEIILTGSDPEGAPLQFQIALPPTQGSLSPVQPLSPASAKVIYTPQTAGDVPDLFTFRAVDPGPRFGEAVVLINPSGDAPAPPPNTVTALGDSNETRQDVPVMLLLRALAPPPVNVTFTIVPSSGPFNGTLGPIGPGPIPGKTAVVQYTPASGFNGSDSFQFQACGIILSQNVCSTATFSLTVTPPEPPPDLAEDIETTTLSNTATLISLFTTSTSQSSSAHMLKPMAVFQDTVEIAGNVADANNDGIGDNANILPGPAPIFMNAGRGLTGGPGSNGTVRMHMEWDITSFNGTLGNLVSAVVNLPTNRGPADALDTLFFAAGVDGNGVLNNADFATLAEPIPGSLMKVPPSMPVGTDGTFSFDVYQPLKSAVERGFNYFVVQGRLPVESGPAGRGLSVRTTAGGNGLNVPRLTLASPGVLQPTIATITSLSAFGTLSDNNTPITSVPYQLSGNTVRYTPNNGFTGIDTFGFTVSIGQTADAATVTINVTMPDCAVTAEGCSNGR